MKVLHVAPSHARRDGGPSETLRGLIPELAKIGVEVTLLSTDKGVAADDVDIERLCEVVLAGSRPPRSWNFAPGIVGHLRRLLPGADVVHIHSVNSFTTTAAMIMSRAMGKPYILEPHGALDTYHVRQGARKKALYSRLVDGWGFGALDRVVYSSERELEQGRITLDRPGVMMPLGVDERLLSLTRRGGHSSPRLLFLGRVAHKKRVDLAIKSLTHPTLRRLGATLWVAGPIDDDLAYDPLALADQLGVADRVTFLGRVDADRRMELLSEADVFVLVSEDESFGVAVAEAMAAGCGVVATVEVGLAAAAAQAGALVASDLSGQSVGDAVVEALEAGPALGRRARSYAAENFRWSIAASRIAHCYEDVAQGQPR